MTKVCNDCKRDLPLAQFGRDSAKSDGLRLYCRDCVAERSKRYVVQKAESCRLYRAQNKALINTRARARYAADAERQRARQRAYMERNREAASLRIRNWQLMKKFNMTLAEWEALFEAQGRVCAACGSSDPKRAGPKGSWHTDHCHATGKVRGILCHHCNLALGHVKDSPEALLNLYSYLTGRLPGV